MFICHIFILIGFGAGTGYPIYVFTYPVIYLLIGIILAMRKPELWLSDAIFINILPLVYWYALLWSDGKMNVQSALSLRESSGMLLIMPFTLALTCAVSFTTSKIKRSIALHRGTAGGS
jgi:hypothetical protein